MAGELRRPSMQYPGLPGLISAEYTCSHGTTPGVVTAIVHPQLDSLVYIANVLFSDDISSFVLHGCRIAGGSATVMAGGILATIHLQDRRWMFEHATISGTYNVPIVRIFDLVPRPFTTNDAGVVQPGGQVGNLPIPEAALFPDGLRPQIQEWTRKSARELGKLLFEALGEKIFDVSALPDDEYPHVDWDVASARNELDALCDQFGCRFIWRADLDCGVIAVIGVGGDLPPADTDEMQEDNAGVDVPEPPAKISVYGSAKRWQVRFWTECVMPDFDGTWRRLSEVSYRPLLGWTGTSGYGPANVEDQNQLPVLPSGYTAQDAYRLAQMWLYRVYRIGGTLPDPNFKAGNWMPSPGQARFRYPADPAKAQMFHRRQDIILTPWLNETSVDNLGQRNVMPGKVWGRSSFGRLNRTEAISYNDRIYVPFTVDVDHQLFIFDEPLEYPVAEALIGPATAAGSIMFGGTLERPTSPYYRDVVAYGDGSHQHTIPTNPVVEVAVMLKDFKNHQVIRYKKTYPQVPQSKRKRESTKGDPGEMAIVKEEIRFSEIQRYFETVVSHPTNPPTATFYDDAINNQAGAVIDNKAEAEDKAKYFVLTALKEMQVKTPQTRIYNGIKLVFCDGAIWQVTWRLDPSGTTTTASRSNEHNLYIPPYAVRRERQYGNVDEARRLDQLRVRNRRVIERIRRLEKQ